MMNLKDYVDYVVRALQGMTRKNLEGDCVDVTIDEGKCTNCGACRAMSAMTRVGCFEKINSPGSEFVCLKCANCTAFCREDAIKVGDLPPPTPIGEIPTSDQLIALMQSRRSIRSFKKKKLSKKDWAIVIAAANAVATSHNSRLLKFVGIEDPEIIRAMSGSGMSFWNWTTKVINRPVFDLILKRKLGEHTHGVFAKLAVFIDQQMNKFEQKEDPILFNAPALMLICAPKGEKMSKEEAALAAQNVMLAAVTAEGGSCISGVFRAVHENKFKKLQIQLNLPPRFNGYEAYFALMLGYPKFKPEGVPYRKDMEFFLVKDPNAQD